MSRKLTYFIIMLQWIIGFWEFIKALWTDVTSRISGGLSVPLTALAFFLTPLWQKIGFAILAVISLSVSANQVWQEERRKVKHLKERLTPMLEFSCSDSIPGCVVYGPFRENAGYKYLRLRVGSRSSNRLTQCTGYARSISSTRENLLHHPVKLTFAPSQDSDTTLKNIESGVEVFLDVLKIHREPLKIEVCTPTLELPPDCNIDNFFRGNGIYRFELYVASNEAVVQNCILEFNWANNWALANMKLV